MTQAPGPRPRSAALRIAFVNNMPDATFAETERRLVALLERGAGETPLLIDRYLVDSMPRDSTVLQGPAAPYRRLRGLYATHPDAVVVIGGERTAPALDEEPLWEPLAELCEWAPTHTASMVLSGLAGHLAARHLEGLEPRRTGRKRRIPEPDHVDTTHVLGRALPATVSTSCAGGEIPLSAMLARGYEPVLAGGDHWTVVTAAREGCLLVLVQGLLCEHGPDHPAGRGHTWAEALSANWLDEVSRRTAEEVRFSGVAAPLVAG